MSAGRPPPEVTGSHGESPYKLRTLAGLPEGQTPMFAKCPVHAGTGATTSCAPIAWHWSVRSTRAQGQQTAGSLRSRRCLSGPRGHRGNLKTPPTAPHRIVRPTRAQGQQVSQRQGRSAVGPAHAAGTGATGGTTVPALNREVRPTRAQEQPPTARPMRWDQASGPRGPTSGSGSPCRPRLRARKHPPQAGAPYWLAHANAV